MKLAGPLACLRAAAVGSDDEAGGNPLGAAIGCSCDDRLWACLKALDRHATAHFRANGFRGGEQRFLHLGVREGETGKLLWGCFEKIARAKAEIRPGEFAGAVAAKHFEDAEFFRFGDAPRANVFSADAVPEAALLFEDEDFGAAFGHSAGESGGTKSATDGDDVIARCGHASHVIVGWHHGRVNGRCCQVSSVWRSAGNEEKCGLNGNRAGLTVRATARGIQKNQSRKPQVQGRHMGHPVGGTKRNTKKAKSG